MTSALGSWLKWTTDNEAVLAEVLRERKAQDRKWGEQNHDPFKWLAILGEEVGEVNKAALEHYFGDPNPKSWDPKALGDYRTELIQVAAVAVAMVQCLDREKWNNEK